MSHQALIIEKIEKAMEFACEQSELFTDAKANPIAAEYLFTVAVAASIAELNGPPGEPYVIRVERDVATFTADCMRPIKFERAVGFGKGRMIRRGKPNVDRAGRVDVTVYMDRPNSGYLGVPPLCAVEVKGFNPNVDVVLADLRRNLTYLRVEGDTGASVLDFTVFAAFHSYNRLGDKDLVRNEQRVRKKYEAYLAQLGDLSDIEREIRVKTVSVEQVGTVIQGVEYDELDTSSKHHFVGAIVVMSRAIPGTPASR